MPQNFTIRVGSSSRTSLGRTVEVRQAVLHPQYDSEILENDVAVLRLNENLKYNDAIQAIQLDCKRPVPDKTPCVVSGWGKDDDGFLPEQLREVWVEIINKKKCQREYNVARITLAKSALCAGLQAGVKDSCNGDSVCLSGPRLLKFWILLLILQGGPLVAKGKLVGIVSAGKDCGRKDFPGIYTDVFKTCKWIKDTCKM